MFLVRFAEGVVYIEPNAVWQARSSARWPSQLSDS